MPNSAEQLFVLKATLERLDTEQLPDSARDLLQQALEQTEALAQAQAADQYEAVQAKGRFASTVTHELRLPLTSIKGYTDLLRQGIVGPVNDQQKNFLNVIRNNVERMSALIANLSDMSYVETGRLKLNPKPVSPGAAVEEALQGLRGKIDEKKQALTVDVPASLPHVQADPSRLTQVLANLLTNAYMYTPAEGKISITASLEPSQVRFSVQDNGIGINEFDQEKLFSPFFRSEDEAVRELQGWGLALHVSMLLVHAQGGQIGAESKLKEGSTFWFSLPVAN